MSNDNRTVLRLLYAERKEPDEISEELSISVKQGAVLKTKALAKISVSGESCERVKKLEER